MTVPDPIKEFDALWFLTEPEGRSDLITEWSETRPGVLRIVKHMWRARKQGLEVYDVLPKDWERLCERYRQCCAYCGERKKLTLDHVIPLTLGGRHSIGNILPACTRCNQRKGSKLLSQHRKRVWRKKHRLTS